jgi:transcription elongation factor S-II
MIVKSPQNFRKNVRNKINIILKQPVKSTNLEIGVYNFAIKEANTRKVVKKWDNDHFVQLYVYRLRTIYNNIKNPTILKQLMDDSIAPQALAMMSHYEMCPEKWDALITKKIERDINKYDTQIEAATDTFTCRKCKSKKCTYYQMQTRSADEPMTTFVSCINCGARWKC